MRPYASSAPSSWSGLRLKFDLASIPGARVGECVGTLRFARPRHVPSSARFPPPQTATTGQSSGRKFVAASRMERVIPDAKQRIPRRVLRVANKGRRIKLLKGDCSTRLEKRQHLSKQGPLRPAAHLLIRAVRVQSHSNFPRAQS
jgi:hypothetical protein